MAVWEAVKSFSMATKYRLLSLATLGYMSGTAPMTLQPPQKASTKHWPGCMSASIMGRMSLIILAFDPKYFIVIKVNKKENPALGFPLVSSREAYNEVILFTKDLTLSRPLN